jgi:hypothetical protein
MLIDSKEIVLLSFLMQDRLLMIENANPLLVEIYIFGLAKYINYHQDYQGIEIKKPRIIFWS